MSATRDDEDKLRDDRDRYAQADRDDQAERAEDERERWRYEDHGTYWNEEW